MRVLLLPGVLCLGLAVGTVAGPASADPLDDGYTPFIDTPQIVDSYPLQVESWSVIDDDRSLRLHFTSGTPECFGVHATVRETPQTVEVLLRSGARPQAVARACIMVAVSGALDVPLSAPLGDRAVSTPF